MKSITCVVDNTVSAGSKCWGEHGLAFLIETDAGRVLFDTGASGTVLLHNLEALDVAPETLDALVISHAHFDHSGGLPALLPHLHPDTPLYAHSDLFRPRYARRAPDAEPVSIGLPFEPELFQGSVSVTLSSAPQSVAAQLWTTGEILSRAEPEGRSNSHGVFIEGAWRPDPYRDDMGLVADLGDGLALICGCCHAGLLNTLAHVQATFGHPVRVIIGGTHLGSASPAELHHVGEALAQMPALERVYLNHCSGPGAYLALTTALGADVVRPLAAGERLDATFRE
jgi:7,8-dihydropterin-6-yl-methyl-4-(beta-D-ribofuranosyl)aminobenzene 5'-phosphate synthase